LHLVLEYGSITLLPKVRKYISSRLYGFISTESVLNRHCRENLQFNKDILCGKSTILLADFLVDQCSFVIFGPKRDEVTGEWRKFHNEELRDLYSSPSTRIIKSRKLRWAGHVARRGKKTNVYRLLVGKPEGKRPLRRPRRRWVNNIRMDLC
jgi:hypothetical protein